MNYNNIMTDFVRQEYALKSQNMEVKYVVISSKTLDFIYESNREILYNSSNNGKINFCGNKVLIDNDLKDGEIIVAGNADRRF
jgi:hypothetical protein